MRISVIIPTYNRANFIGKAIDSVLNQSFGSHEIIVIDDGSTDGTRDTLSSYAGRIKYFYQKNSGVSCARNEGVKQAQGDWVAFLDSDDEWKPEYLYTQATQAKQFPQAIAHITNAVTIRRDGTATDIFTNTGVIEKFKAASCLLLERPLHCIIKNEPWYIQSTILRRDILLKVGLFDEGLSIAEDLDVICRAALEGPFTLCRDEMVNLYRRQEAMLSLSEQSLRNGIYRYRAYEKVYLDLLNSRGLTIIEMVAAARALSSTRRALGNVFVLANRKTDARTHYIKSFLSYPSIGAVIKSVATFLPGSASLALVRKGRDVLPGNEAQSATDLGRRN